MTHITDKYQFKCPYCGKTFEPNKPPKDIEEMPYEELQDCLSDIADKENDERRDEK